MAWADALKGLLIILVAFWHVVLKTFLEIDWRLGVPIPGAWGLAADVIWPFLMPLFLLVSGFFAARALQRPWAVVLRPRVVRFLFLYLLWTIIHMVTMWAFPDFPTFVPRSVSEFVEAITISPPNTWYVYALALYFLLAKSCPRGGRWVLLLAAGALSIAVTTGLIDVVSNRGSLLYNLFFFLLGAFFAPRVQRFVQHPRVGVAVALVLLFAAAYAAMRVLHAQTMPGVWPAVSIIGVAMGLTLAPLIARTPVLGPGLSWLGRRTLPIYLIHMPVLAVLDALLVPLFSDSPRLVQLGAALLLPVVLTAGIIAVSTTLGGWIERDGPRWLFELPRRRQHADGVEQRGRAGTAVRRRMPWRVIGGITALALLGVLAVAMTGVPTRPAVMPQTSTTRVGEVSIGATGDILVYDAATSVPADRGLRHFDAVRRWMTEDVVTGNLEQAVSPDTGYDKCAGQRACLAFRSDPDVARSLSGFDVLNLANNHSRDFGTTGYANTRRILDGVGVRTVGDRDEVSWTRVGRMTVAIVGFAPYDGFNRVTDLRRVRQLIRTVSNEADVVVVHAHMGAEGPNADRVSRGTESMYGENRGDVVAFSHTAIDAGADIVIGHGPHILRGIEAYRGRIIAYSLGNFGGGGVFGAEQETRYGAYLSVRLRADGSLVAGRVRSVGFTQADGVPLPDPSENAAKLMDERGVRDFGSAAVRVAPDGVLTLPPEEPR